MIATRLSSKEKLPVARVYIDGANMFYAQKDLGWIFDWVKLKKIVEKKFKCKEFFYYTPLKSKELKQAEQIKRFLKWGFKVITKSPKKIKGELKANFDVEISLDIILAIIDGWKGDFVLFSGDSDFAYLVKILNKKFRRKVFVFSTKKFLSWELKYLVDKYFLLEDFKKEIYFKKWFKRVLTKRNKRGIKENR